ncbi:hypothetical protein [Parvibaculum sp.]|jgi:hypothetical protein|uniref:hypothetical protein n=1 Tax=Parvibaculum sp. TaxID=2024848 RepID=UPI0032980253
MTIHPETPPITDTSAVIQFNEDNPLRKLTDRKLVLELQSWAAQLLKFLPALKNHPHQAQNIFDFISLGLSVLSIPFAFMNPAIGVTHAIMALFVASFGFCLSRKHAVKLQRLKAKIGDGISRTIKVQLEVNARFFRISSRNRNQVTLI